MCRGTQVVEGVSKSAVVVLKATESTRDGRQQHCHCFLAHRYT